MKENNNFKMGLRDGMAIGVGYLAVGFAFGLSSSIAGLSYLEAFFISLFNLTSAGQLAGMPIIAAGGLCEGKYEITAKIIAARLECFNLLRHTRRKAV